ncbi:MAG: hypothetical protein ACP5NB_03540, partial [Chloroflexia bacterium]
MGKEHPVNEAPLGRSQPVPRWTFWEVLGLFVSVVLVLMPLLSVAYTFIFPPSAPAEILLPSPTPIPSITPPTATPTPLVADLIADANPNSSATG